MMKLAARAASLSTLLLGHASTYSVVTKDTDPFLRKDSLLAKYSGDPAAPAGVAVGYGDTACPCIGFDGIKGEIAVELESDGQQVAVQYPKALGARCESWDLARHPECLSNSPEWCAKKWCFVDSCNCHIDVMPEPSVLLPMAMYRGHTVAYSYATCDGDLHKKHPMHGSPGCQCVGFENAPGTIKIELRDGDSNKVSKLDYPASLGGTCKSWDSGRHPDCKGDDVPAWCGAQWCYVDPCSCELEGGHVPKISSYLPEATFTGKGFYYSYETCGAEDTWTKKHHPTACVNQATPKLCNANSRCAWSGKRCLGRELVLHPLCEDLMRWHAKSGAPPLKPMSVVVVTAAACMAAAAIGRFA